MAPLLLWSSVQGPPMILGSQPLCPKASTAWPSLPPDAISLVLTSLPLSVSLKDPGDCVGLTWMIRASP